MARIHLDPEDRAALRRFGLSSVTTGTVYVEPAWDYLPGRAVTTVRHNVPQRPPVGVVGRELADMADRYEPTYAERRAARLAGVELPTFPAANVVIGASTDPMHAHPWSLALEHAATAFLALHGERCPRPDVWNRRHGSFVTRPDVVAFRGTARYVPPAAARYGRNGRLAAAESRPTVRLADVSDTPDWRTWTLTELLTTDRTATDGKTRAGWRGHRRITWTVDNGHGARTVRRAARRARRAAEVGTTRGPARGAWTLAERSLARRIDTDDKRDNVARLEELLRTSADGATLTFGTVSVVVTGPAQVVTDTGRAYPVREWARRATLAGIDAASIDA